MSFMQKTVTQSLPIWDQYKALPFLQELKKGTLPAESFRLYMIQGGIYLKGYALVSRMAIYRAETLREIQLYHAMLGFTTVEESAVRLAYLKKFGMTDDGIKGIKPLPQTQNYLDFLFEVTERAQSPKFSWRFSPAC